MEMSTTQLMEAVLRKTPEERAWIATTLISSLEETHDAEAEVAWQAEISRRLSDSRSGKAATYPWSEVKARVEKVIHEARHHS